MQNAVSKSGHLLELKRRRTFETNKEKEIREYINSLTFLFCTIMSWLRSATPAYRKGEGGPAQAPDVEGSGAGLGRNVK
jgi:hypothetical protein